MKRRDVLGLTAAGFVALSGCSSGGGSTDGGDDGPPGEGTPDETTDSSSDGGGGSSICSSADFPLTRAEAVDDSTVDLGFRNQIGQGIQPIEIAVTLNNAQSYTGEFPEGTTVEDGDEFSVQVEIEADPDSIFNIDLFYRDASGECSMGNRCPHRETVCLTGVI